ncbi:hypothetical protein [Sphingomonas corticis]|uniref:DUF2384 domain-containing protein n=1 Tax=Sphingomonas corticis TaxID=2722791 RepID=A0ABX1CRG4_9SPHN|nr:hypothetical protein [Sphingomonas corticis]NJR80064.1 hypothetical protein [Sphingomonas corticis]
MDQGEAAAAELRMMRRAWNALRAQWRLDRREVLELLRGAEGAGTLSAATETRMRLLVEIGYRLCAADGDDDLRDRLRRPTAAFGWLSPLEAMSGGTGELRAVRVALETGAWS